MTGDVSDGDVKSPRGSIVPPGCTLEEIDGRQVLRIPSNVTRVDTPIIFPGFTVVIEAPLFTVDGPSIVNASIASEAIEATESHILTSKEIEVIGLLQAQSVRARIVRGARIEAREIEADVSVRAAESIVVRRVSVRDGAVRAPRVISEELHGENAADESFQWSDAVERGLVPEWLRDG